MREESRGLGGGCGESWLPDDVLLLIVGPIHEPGIGHPRKDQGIDTNLGEDACISGRVSERVQLPADVRVHTKLLKQPMTSNYHVVYDVMKGNCSLICRHSSSMHELKLLVRHQNLDFVLFLRTEL